MTLNWNPITSAAEVESIRERSLTVPCLILKHSTTCNISAIAKYRLDTDWDFEPDVLEPYYLDLLRFRPVSAYIAETFAVYHESPQVLLMVGGECVYDASHLDIRVEELKEALAGVAK
ncbi:MAG: bacillithiol system redox-active protein YtxJ [Saprospiraceae bacterium]|nr:bacillithiol system redox-active protein YtxJ [Saprospiraceae bacterium]